MLGEVGPGPSLKKLRLGPLEGDTHSYCSISLVSAALTIVSDELKNIKKAEATKSKAKIIVAILDLLTFFMIFHLL
jgi:hypothetical protein